jgi:serine/threonine protein kinase
MLGDLMLAQDDIKTGKRLGCGGFGAVYRGTWQGKPVAIKELREKAIPDPQQFMKYFLREVQVMSRMSHPAIVGLVGCRLPDEQGRARIVMELCATCCGTSLRGTLPTARGRRLRSRSACSASPPVFCTSTRVASSTAT